MPVKERTYPDYGLRFTLRFTSSSEQDFTPDSRGAKVKEIPRQAGFLAELVNAYKIGEKNDLFCHETFRTSCPQSLDFFP